MNDSVLTIRLPLAVRRRVEHFAEREDRSLSQAAVRLIELGLAAGTSGASLASQGDPAPGLEGAFAGGPVATLEEVRAVRAELSQSFETRQDRVEAKQARARAKRAHRRR